MLNITLQDNALEEDCEENCKPIVKNQSDADAPRTHLKPMWFVPVSNAAGIRAETL